MYRTVDWKAEIVPVEVERVGEKSVWVRNDRRGKTERHALIGAWNQYHHTWEEARQFLLKKAEASAQSLRLQLERANGHVGNIKGLKEPNP